MRHCSSIALRPRFRAGRAPTTKPTKERNRRTTFEEESDPIEPRDAGGTLGDAPRSPPRSRVPGRTNDGPKTTARREARGGSGRTTKDPSLEPQTNDRHSEAILHCRLLKPPFDFEEEFDRVAAAPEVAYARGRSSMPPRLCGAGRTNARPKARSRKEAGGRPNERDAPRGSAGRLPSLSRRAFGAAQGVDEGTDGRMNSSFDVREGILSGGDAGGTQEDPTADPSIARAGKDEPDERPSEKDSAKEAGGG